MPKPFFYNIKPFQKNLVTFLLFSFALFIAAYVAMKLNLFMTKELSYPFRADNFWAYSSSIFRRGLTGEIIYNLDILTGKGIYLFTFSIWSFFVLFLARFLKELRRELSVTECILFIFSPFLLLYSVDAEIFTLLPFLTLFSKNHKVCIWGTLALIVISTLIREISLLFYFPVLIYFMINGQRHLKLTAGLILLILLSIALFPKPSPTYFLENSYWSTLELQKHSLYKFSDMPISQVLPMHLDFIFSKWQYFVIPVTCFLLLATSLFYKRTSSALGSLYLFSMISACFVLTVDYGRYFYLFIMLTVLASSPSTYKYFTTFPAILNFNGINSLLGCFLKKIESNKSIILLIAVISPSGYWAGDYQIKPRFYTLMSESDFLTIVYTYLFK